MASLLFSFPFICLHIFFSISLWSIFSRVPLFSILSRKQDFVPGCDLISPDSVANAAKREEISQEQETPLLWGQYPLKKLVPRYSEPMAQGMISPSMVSPALSNLKVKAAKHKPSQEQVKCSDLEFLLTPPTPALSLCFVLALLPAFFLAPWSKCWSSRTVTTSSAVWKH